MAYQRVDGATLSANEVQRLLDHEGNTWERTDSLSWWDSDQVTEGGVPARLAQYSTDRNVFTVTLVEEMGAFMSRAPELNAAYPEGVPD